MHRQIPMANKLCFQKNLERDMDIHKSKIKNISCSIDKTSPQAFQFLNSKKPTANNLARNDEIERENNILLRKITNIMKLGSQDPTLKRTTSIPVIRQKPKSLNSEVRKRDLVKIVIENQAILRRIQAKKSAYDVKKWNKDRQTVEKYINNKCEFQYKNYNPTHTQVKLGSWENSQISQTPNNQYRSQKNFKLKPIEHQQTKGIKQIFNTTRKIGLDYYYIDVKVAKGVFSIVLDNIEKSNQRYTIELLEKEGMTIWKKECQCKPEILLERVRVDERSKTVFFRRINDHVSISRDKIDSISEGDIGSNRKFQNSLHTNNPQQQQQEDVQERSINEEQDNNNNPDLSQQKDQNLSQLQHQQSPQKNENKQVDNNNNSAVQQSPLNKQNETTEKIQQQQANSQEQEQQQQQLQQVESSEQNQQQNTDKVQEQQQQQQNEQKPQEQEQQQQPATKQTGQQQNEQQQQLQQKEEESNQQLKKEEQQTEQQPTQQE